MTAPPLAPPPAAAASASAAPASPTPTGPPVAAHLWALLLLAVASAHLATAWAGWRPVLVLPVVAIAAYLVTTLAFRIGVPGWLASGTVLTLCGLAAELVAGPSDAPFGSAIRDAVPRLLTSPRPAPATAALLVPGVVAVVVAAVWVAVRQRRRGGACLAPVVAALALYLGAALLSAGRADPQGIVAALLVTIGVLGWLRLGASAAAATTAAPAISAAGRVPAEPTSRRRGQLARPLALLAVVVGTAVAVAAVAPREAAYEPREQIAPPQELLTEPSPLPRLSAWAQEGDVPLLSVATERPLPLRLVALVDYDGATWRTPVAYRPFGVETRDPLGVAARVATVELDVAVGQLVGPWIPTPGKAVDSTIEQLYVDDPSMTLASPDGLDVVERYGLVAEVDDARDGDVRDAAVSRGAETAPYVALPDLPVDLAELARTTIQGASTPFEQALLIEAAVRDGRRLDSSAPAGSSYARLRTFLLGDDEPGAQSGTSEQFATAFTLLARANGLPTRIVVGFQPDVRDADGRWDIRGRDALAWPEVHFAGWGWVRFSPTPDTPDIGLDDEIREQVLADLRRDPLEDDLDEPDDLDDPNGLDDPNEPSPESAAADPPGSGGSSGAGAVPLAVPIVVAVGAIAVVVTARSWRRWRHRRAGARGAWSEILDLLVLVGARPPAALPAPAIAAELASRWPVADAPHPAVVVAAAADHDAFAPPGGSASSERDVAVALRDVRRLVRRHVPVWRRVAWPLDPRPLRRRSPRRG